MATSDLHPASRAYPAHALDRTDERWLVVTRVLASSYFSRSPRLSSFLQYICERSLDGRTADLNERAIGMDVFGRQATYNPGDDSIVRSQARLLRGRLEQYFQSEGKDAAWHISVPKGSYVPVFARQPRAGSEEGGPSGESLRAGVAEHPGWQNGVRHGVPGGVLPRHWLWMVVAAAVLATVAVSAWRALRSEQARALVPPNRQLWSALFEPGRTALIVPADSTLSVIEGRSKSPALLSDYLKHTYPEPAADSPVRMNDYQLTTIADLKLAVRVARLPEALPGRLEVKYPRDLTVNDARDANLMLIGGIRANPWVQLFTSQLHFQIEADRIVNTAPRGAEQASYPLQLQSATPRSFGIIAWLPGLAGGHTLLVEGSDMAGTEAAGDFLFDEAAFHAFAGRLGADHGPLPHFEALLAATTLNGNASHVQVVAYHLIP